MLHLNLLGGFRLFAGDCPLSEPRAKKARALLAYLALQNGRVVSRNHLAALLWANTDDQRARHSLSQALSAIHGMLKKAGYGGLELSSETARLDPSVLDVDVQRFRALALKDDLESLGGAVALYEGEMLDGLLSGTSEFEAWLQTERIGLREVAAKAMARLADAQVGAGQSDDAIATVLKLLALDPLRESAHRALIELYASQGRNHDALRQFRTLERLLKRELSMQPEAETKRLAQRIMRSRDKETPRSSDKEAVVWRPPRPPMHGEVRDGDALPSVVVLPFADYGDDPDPDGFADALTDDLINDLSRISGLLVIARSTSLAYRNRIPGIRRVAADLGVGYVVEGAVRRTGNRLRVNVQFIDGLTERLIWADRFERDMESVFLLQNEITGRIAACLRLELLRAESRRMDQGPPANLTAWSHALRGWTELWAKPVRKESFLQAKQFVEKALDRDPSLALAWTAMARIHYIAALYPFGAGERFVSYRSALDAARTAVTLDPNCAEAYAELGSALKTQKNYDEAVQACETALQLNPNYEEAYANLATIRKDQGNPEEALPLFKKSLRIAPHLPTDGRRNYFIAWTYLLAGEHEKALAFANRSLAIDSGFSGPHWIRACVFGWRDRPDLAAEALAAVERTDCELATIENFAKQYAHVTNNEYAIEGLLRAGMREK